MIPYLLALLVPAISTEITSTEISVLRYKALQYQEIENLEHLYYNFEFCSCEHSYTGVFPDRSSQCVCSKSHRGRSVLKSTPQANFASSCVHSFSRRNCLNVKLSSKEATRKMYVKVKIGNKIFTYPTWQNLPIRKYKTSTSLKSAVGSDMKIDYVVSLKKSRTRTVNRKKPARYHTKTRQHTFKSYRVRPDMFDYMRRKFSKATGRSHTHDHQEQSFSGLSNQQKANAIAQYETKTTRSSYHTHHTTARPPTVSSSSNSDIRDVLGLKNINDVRKFLLQKSLVERKNPASYDVNSLKNEILRFHNVYRKKHHSGDVSRSSKLDTAAQRWADHLGNSQGCLVHEKPQTYGENLFYFSSHYLPDAVNMAKGVIQGFYMEGNGYNYKHWNPRSYFKVGHFTQLIWKSSRHIGVGVSIRHHSGSKKGPCQPHRPAYMVYVCVKYDPPGNMQSYDAYMKNVVSPISG